MYTYKHFHYYFTINKPLLLGGTSVSVLARLKIADCLSILIPSSAFSNWDIISISYRATYTAWEILEGIADIWLITVTSLLFNISSFFFFFSLNDLACLSWGCWHGLIDTSVLFSSPDHSSFIIIYGIFLHQTAHDYTDSATVAIIIPAYLTPFFLFYSCIYFLQDFFIYISIIFSECTLLHIASGLWLAHTIIHSSILSGTSSTDVTRSYPSLSP